MTQVGFITPAGLLCASLLLSMTAQAEHPLLEKRNALYLGAFDQTLSADLGAQRDDLPSDIIEIDDIGVDDDDVSWMLEYRHRFSDRWSLTAAAYRYRNSGGTVLEESFNFDGVEFTAGLETRSRLEIDTYILDAMYSMYTTDNTEIAIGGGLHALDNFASIRAIGSIDGNEVFDTSEAGSSLLAPLPNLRATAFHAFSDRFATMVTLGWLSANVDEYEGSFGYAHVRAQYQIYKGLGIALGYQAVEVDITRNLDNGKDTFDLGFDGVTAALTYTF